MARSPVTILKSGLKLLGEAFWAFISDGAFSLAAAVAFYSSLSLGPLLVIMLWITSLFGEETQDALIGQVQALIGPQAGRGIELIIENAERQPELGTLAGIFGVGTLIFASTTVFAQLQYAMNVIWGVEAKPGHSIWDWFRTRLMSLGMVISVLFLLVLSLAISTTISVVIQRLSEQITWLDFAMPAVDFTVSLIIFTLLFALIFKYLPDITITWRQVWLGAGVTALLFGIGKILIGLYLGQSSIGSSYGAAGSLVVLLIWVNISTIMLFYGAEITQIVSRRLGFRMTPNRYAIWVDAEKRTAMSDDRSDEDYARDFTDPEDGANGEHGDDSGAPSSPQHNDGRGRRRHRDRDRHRDHHRDHHKHPDHPADPSSTPGAQRRRQR